MIHGNMFTREVTIDGVPLDPRPSQEIYNHSPDGFAWGYAGSGPAQLALAILLFFTDRKFSEQHYQQLKFDVLYHQNQHRDLRLDTKDVLKWIEAKGYKQ